MLTRGPLLTLQLYEAEDGVEAAVEEPPGEPMQEVERGPPSNRSLPGKFFVVREAELKMHCYNVAPTQSQKRHVPDRYMFNLF